jgi:hypothetical protein
VTVANRLLSVSGHAARVNFSVRDALAADGMRPSAKFDGIISAMLAEHLTAPRPLFAALARQVTDTGSIFFSTALESPQRDHVYEFHRESEPLKMAEEAGMRATRMISGASAVRPGMRFLPRATAMILQPVRTA